MPYNFRSTGETKNTFVELIYDDGPFQGISWYYEGMKFADQENEDGSIQMSFDYTITSNEQPSNVVEFEQSIGDVLIYILEEQVKKGEVVYHGDGEGEVQQGTDSPAV